MTILDEIQSEVWHILTNIYTYQRIMEDIPKSSTRYDLANKLVALNALLELLIIRIARLADKRKDTRTISMLLKRGNFSDKVTSLGNQFLTLAEPVLKIRHEQIAHMKPGVLSSYEPKDIPIEVIKATEVLVNFIDITRTKKISYTYKVGSMEPIIDLRASLTSGKRMNA